jgi:hypothetical protein
MPLNKTKGINKSCKQALENKGLTTEENLAAISQHKQSLRVQSCITLLGRQVTLDQGYLELILQCKNLENAAAALISLADEGIAGKQEVQVILDCSPKAREEAVYALSRLNKINLLTDKFREAVAEDRWDGSERGQATSEIKAINILLSSDIHKNLVTEANLSQVLEHWVPASVAALIVECCEATGTEFIDKYAPSILGLDSLETAKLEAIVERLQDNEILTAEVVNSIFEYRIGAKEGNSAEKLNNTFVPGPLYDCLEHLNRCKLKNPVFNLINLPNINRLSQCFEKCPDMETATKFTKLFTNLRPEYLSRNFENFTRECVAGKGSAAENAQAYIDKLLQRKKELEERNKLLEEKKVEIDKEIKQCIKQEVFNLLDERTKNISPQDLESCVTNLLSSGALRSDLEQTQAVITGQIWNANKDIYNNQAECSAEVYRRYLGLTNGELKAYAREYIETEKEKVLATKPASEEATTLLAEYGFFSQKNSGGEGSQNAERKLDESDVEPSFLGIEKECDPYDPNEFEQLHDELIAECEEDENADDLIAQITAATRKIQKNNLATVVAGAESSEEEDEAEVESEAESSEDKDKTMDQDSFAGRSYRR